MMFVMIPAAVGLAVLAPECVSVIYRGGEFDAVAVTRVSRAVACYAVGLAFFGLNKSLVPWFQAQNDMKTPLKVSVCAVVLNMALNLCAVLLLPVEWRHVGLAASTVACAAAGCALLAALARRRNGTLGLAQVAKPIATILGASVAMGVAVSAARPLVSSLPPIAALAALVLLGAAVYGILSLVLLRDQLKKAIRMS